MALELLAPARNAAMGRLALSCGADAVYIGGPSFGARRAAGNSLGEIEQLASEAHRQGARVYAALNTILFDAELKEARALAWALADAGVDALIVQDMAFLEMDLPGIPLHASTQAACDSPEKVAFLASAGFSRAILARELSLAEIRSVRGAVDPSFQLEAFVYGALCVSESGRCSLSHALQGRSGNRGQCAQPCRRSWDLLDGEGRVLLADLPLLSIQDLDATDHLEALADAGVGSFKIEGRMKDADYLKNAVGYVRKKLDALLQGRPDLGVPSGVEPGFVPDPAQTFHRGHTAYRLDGRHRPLLSGPSSGWLGARVGRVMDRLENQLLLDRDPELKSGDGLAWPGPSGRVVSTQVVEAAGRWVVVQDAGKLCAGFDLYRTQRRHWLEAMRAAVPRGPGIRRPLLSPPVHRFRPAPLGLSRLDHRWNVSNALARQFYERHGAREIEPALELGGDAVGKTLMTTRLCLKYELGQCSRHPHPRPAAPESSWVEPLHLVHEGVVLQCAFDCERCQMKIELGDISARGVLNHV